jgi:chaperonin GroES
MAKRLIPLLDRVLIQKAEAVTKTKGGIVIPEKAQGKVLRGMVVAVGPGSRNQVCGSVDLLLSFLHIRG